MNRNVASARAENLMTLEQEALSAEELGELVEILADDTNPRGLDLLALGGVRSLAGLMTRLAAAEPRERDLLLTAIRRLLKSR
jgi:hypothetical protein